MREADRLKNIPLPDPLSLSRQRRRRKWPPPVRCDDLRIETPGNRDAAPAAAASENPDRFLCFALYSASLAMTKLCQPRLKPPGLTGRVAALRERLVSARL